MIRTNSGFTCPDQHEGEKDRNEEAGWGVPDHIYIYNYKQMFWGKKKTYSNSGSYTLFLTLRETSTTCLYRTIFKVIFMLTIGCIAQNRQTLSTLYKEIIKTEFSLKSRWLVSGRSKDFAQFQF